MVGALEQALPQKRCRPLRAEFGQSPSEDLAGGVDEPVDLVVMWAELQSSDEDEVERRGADDLFLVGGKHRELFVDEVPQGRHEQAAFAAERLVETPSMQAQGGDEIIDGCGGVTQLHKKAARRDDDLALIERPGAANLGS